MAANGIVRYMLGGSFPLFTVQSKLVPIFVLFHVLLLYLPLIEDGLDILILFSSIVYEKLGIDWATSLLAFISLALLPVPWLFFKYGSVIRKKSGYDLAYP